MVIVSLSSRYRFKFYLQPLERVPSTVYSYVWSIVVLIKLLDITFKIVIKKPINYFEKLDPVLIGILIGGYITSVKVLPIDFALIRDSFFMLAPLLLFKNDFKGEQK